ncbi:MAG: succinate dehydrogenase / fumarate reductase cytochrome b subunit [Candidatus Azotimanducaceae bacterium]|jgi:succinate dehydrogenase / fumarate reductase cytochrome b subunit
MNTQNKRPLSPHLQIYRLPLNAILSIAHRASGVILSIGALVMVLVLAAAASSAESYACIYGHLASWYGQIFLLGVTFSLYLHFCNGIRHLFWDVGVGFELDTVAKSSKLVIAGTIILTAATWLTALNAG